LLVVLPAASLLGGCSSGKASINPVDWWHNLEGGKIAEERPPPPNADAPYPNLSTVPARPTPPDREAMKRLTDALIGDRQNAQYIAASDPLADPSSPGASPNLFGAGTLPPPPPPVQPGEASASLPAASPTRPQPAPTPEAPPAPPSRAPVAAVQSTPIEPPAPPPAPPPVVQAAPAPAVPPPVVQTTPAPPVSVPAAPAPVVAEAPPADMPPMSAAPPARPGVAGAAPPVLPEPPEAAPTPPGGTAARIGFSPGSAALSPEDAASVKQFAGKRGNATIVVTGYGDAAGNDLAAQTAALSLGLSRAQAVANALTAAGVPQGAMRVGAEAAGRGARISLLQ
jgi:outer membrane protein OmpA-like peptidoglycan-associated protein